ncbi:MAG: sulfotransferase, partial [Gaiellales bacterium]
PATAPPTVTAPPILITGAHRSGTTWVGRTLAQSPELGYLDEPFGLLHRPGTCAVSFRHWFPYVTGDDERLRSQLERTLSFRYSYADELPALRSARDAARMVRDAAHFASLRRRGARPLMKDPVALLSAPWLAQQFDMRVIVLIRHPAAFASSLQRMGWTHPFSHFLEQPRLVDDLVPQLEPDIREMAARPHDVIDQACLLWNIFHLVIARYRESHPDWLFVRHEDISREPREGYRRLCAHTAVEYSPRIEHYAAATSRPGNPAEPLSGVAHQLHRDSAANVRTWQNRLDPADIHRIRRRTEIVANAFYDESDW